MILRVNRILKKNSWYATCRHVQIHFLWEKNRTHLIGSNTCASKSQKKSRQPMKTKRVTFKNPHDVPMNPGWFIGIIIYWLAINIYNPYYKWINGYRSIIPNIRANNQFFLKSLVKRSGHLSTMRSSVGGSQVISPPTSSWSKSSRNQKKMQWETGWWFQPISKILVKMGIFPR